MLFLAIGNKFCKNLHFQMGVTSYQTFYMLNSTKQLLEFEHLIAW